MVKSIKIFLNGIDPIRSRHTPACCLRPNPGPQKRDSGIPAGVGFHRKGRNDRRDGSDQTVQSVRGWVRKEGSFFSNVFIKMA